MNSIYLSNDHSSRKTRARSYVLNSVVLLMLLHKILIISKIKFPPSNSLNLAELVLNELMMSISKKKRILILFFISNLSLFNVKMQR